MTFTAARADHPFGQVIGSGHCVPYVRHATDAPITTQWRRGEKVRGSQLPPGTAIATFDPSGRYGNHVDGRSHAAVLLAVNDDGLLVVDQWLGQPVHQRTIRYRGGKGDPANDGDQYFAVEIA